MRTLVGLLIVLTASAVSAQQEEWVRFYNGTGDTADHGAEILFDSAGYLYVGGQSYDSANANDFLIIKYNTRGDQQWVATYDGATHLSDHLYGIGVDGSGGVYVTGSTQVTAFPLIRHDYLTVKYDSAGDMQWDQTHDGPDSWSDAAFGLAVSAEGNVYVTGHSHYLDTYTDYLTIAYGAAGGVLWTRRYWGPDSAISNYDYAQGIALDSDGNAYVTGYIRQGMTDDDCATVKYSSAGDMVWATLYDGPLGYSDHATEIVVDGAGYPIVAGKSQGTLGYWDYVTIKYDGAGDEVWARRYDGSPGGSDEVGALAVDASGNVYVTGSSYDSTSGYDIATIKYASDGQELWVSRYSGPGNSADVGGGIAVDDSGNVYVTGFSYWSCVTIKYDRMGDEQWVALYNGPDSLQAAGMAVVVDDSGYVYVTGGSKSATGDYDCLTIKYGPSTAIEDEPQRQWLGYETLRIYPNPLSGHALIDYSCATPSEVSLVLYDAEGRFVRTIYEGKGAAGKHELPIDCGGLAQGVYFVRLSTGKSSLVRKFVTLR